jgi:hypothetical protein
MNNKQPDYRSYLLRLWWACDDDRVTLRIYIEDPHTSERTAFASLEALTLFLSQEVGLEGKTDDNANGRNV